MPTLARHVVPLSWTRCSALEVSMSWQTVAMVTLETTIALIGTMLGFRAQVSDDVVQNGMQYVLLAWESDPGDSKLEPFSTSQSTLCLCCTVVQKGSKKSNHTKLSDVMICLCCTEVRRGSKESGLGLGLGPGITSLIQSLGLFFRPSSLIFLDFASFGSTLRPREFGLIFF